LEATLSDLRCAARMSKPRALVVLDDCAFAEVTSECGRFFFFFFFFPGGRQLFRKGSQGAH